MRNKLTLDPDVEDEAPVGPELTRYDTEHFVTYMRLLDAEADGADWREITKFVLHRDATSNERRARACFESHMNRAHWMTAHGYRQILQRDARSATPLTVSTQRHQLG